jgi:hypothetical protein
MSATRLCARHDAASTVHDAKVRTADIVQGLAKASETTDVTAAARFTREPAW